MELPAPTFVLNVIGQLAIPPPEQIAVLDCTMFAKELEIGPAQKLAGCSVCLVMANGLVLELCDPLTKNSVGTEIVVAAPPPAAPPQSAYQLAGEAVFEVRLHQPPATIARVPEALADVAFFVTVS